VILKVIISIFHKILKIGPMKSPHTARVEEWFSQMTSKPLHDPSPSAQGEPPQGSQSPTLDPAPDAAASNQAKLFSKNPSQVPLHVPTIFDAAFGFKIVASSAPGSMIHALQTTVTQVPPTVLPKAQPVSHPMFCTLEELYHGTKKQIKIFR
jgi:hypothetical protein